MAEMFDLLKHAIFVNLEVTFLQPGDQNASLVLHCRVQDHQIGLQSKYWFLARAVLGRGGCLRPGDTWQRDQNKKYR
jgi:hypothetical protein